MLHIQTMSVAVQSDNYMAVSENYRASIQWASEINCAKASGLEKAELVQKSMKAIIFSGSDGYCRPFMCIVYNYTSSFSQFGMHSQSLILHLRFEKEQWP